MAQIIDLISRQDLEAFVDEQSTDARGFAIERRLKNDSAAMSDVADLTRMNGDLIYLKSRLYKDQALQRALALLFCQRPRQAPLAAAHSV